MCVSLDGPHSCQDKYTTLTCCHDFHFSCHCVKLNISWITKIVTAVILCLWLCYCYARSSYANTTVRIFMFLFNIYGFIQTSNKLAFRFQMILFVCLLFRK